MEVNSQIFIKSLSKFKGEESSLANLQIVNVAGWTFLCGKINGKTKAFCIAKEENNLPAVKLNGVYLLNILNVAVGDCDSELEFNTVQHPQDKQSADIFISYVDYSGDVISIKQHSSRLNAKEIYVVNEEDFELNE